MPSISFWNRIEPRPRSDKLERHLAAQVRDPMWFLTRQYQFGEFQGEDAASPAYVELKARVAPVTGWYAPGDAVTPFYNKAPLEKWVQTEGFTPDLSTSVELGQYYESLLQDEGLHALIADFRQAYQVPGVDTGDTHGRDHDLGRFLAVCGGRVVHGAKLLNAIGEAHPNLPALPALPAGTDLLKLRRVNNDFVQWVRQTFGEIGREDAPAWQPERLEYNARVTALSPENQAITLEAYPSRDGTFDWSSFDQFEKFTLDNDTERPAPGHVEHISRSVLPAHVVFPGMANNRWWHFEDNRRDFAELRTSRLELGKIVVLDFMLVHGHDWYVVPFAQKVGTLARIDTLLVHDVFGEITLVNRADADPKTPWSMFSVSVKGGGRADYFMLAPSATGVSLQGEPVEQVRFLRDEAANMAWGIEHTTESGTGRPWPGHERAEQLGSEPVSYHPGSDDAPPLKYLLQTRVPEHWIPFVPVQVDAAKRVVALQRAAALRIPTDGGAPTAIQPVARVLTPSHADQNPIYRIREEEIPREGAEVTRRVERARWIDGSTHLWIARKRRPGAGEGRSGLTFDIALEARTGG